MHRLIKYDDFSRVCSEIVLNLSKKAVDDRLFFAIIYLTICLKLLIFACQAYCFLHTSGACDMDETGNNILQIEGPAGTLPIKADDKLTRQLAMLFEGKCLGLGPTQAARKYGYSKQRYFQVLNAFLEGGSRALIPQKTGPKSSHVRTEEVITEIIRHRFLDPDASAAVIAQKIRQTGTKVSQRSVERTLAERGLQKKTLPLSSQRSRPKN